MPLNRDSEAPEGVTRHLWMPPGTLSGTNAWCAKCGDPIEKGKVVFFKHEEDPDHPLVFCRPCAEWYRANQWWSPIYRKKAEQALEDYTHLARHKGKWTQEEIDMKALRWGLERRRKWY